MVKNKHAAKKTKTKTAPKVKSGAKKVATKTKKAASKTIKKSKNANYSTKVGTTLTIGVIAALSAGAYYLYGNENSAKRRRQIKGWMLKMKGDVLDRVEKLKDVNEEAYHMAVDEVTNKYKKMKKVNTEELLVIASDLKKHWSKIRKDVEQAKKELGDDLSSKGSQK